MLFEILILVILIVLSGVFSGMEVALLSVSNIKVKSLLKQKKPGAQALAKLKENPHRLIITILIGNNIANIGAASIATVVFTDLFGSSGVGIATGIMTFLILVFGEITPKTFAAQNAERISLLVARPLNLLAILLHPLVKIFETISKFMSWLLKSKGEASLSEEELRVIVSMGKQEGILGKEAATIMHNVLEFDDIKVTEIMTTREHMEMLDGNKKLKEVIDFIVRSPYSRYPVYDKDKDDIVGIVDVDDILRQVKNKRTSVKLKKMIRKAYFVPETKEIDDLLTEFEGKQIPMALVVDEYSVVIGLVTVEDILEEIVGEIFDKSKRKSVYIKTIRSGVLRVDARAPIPEINKRLRLGIKGGEFDTMAGFVQSKLKRIPKRGEQIKLKKAVIEIDKVTSRGIKSILIMKK